MEEIALLILKDAAYEAIKAYIKKILNKQSLDLDDVLSCLHANPHLLIDFHKISNSYNNSVNNNVFYGGVNIQQSNTGEYFDRESLIASYNDSIERMNKYRKDAFYFENKELMQFYMMLSLVLVVAFVSLAKYFGIGFGAFYNLTLTAILASLPMMYYFWRVHPRLKNAYETYLDYVNKAKYLKDKGIVLGYFRPEDIRPL